jgi:hypothetical protein
MKQSPRFAGGTVEAVDEVILVGIIMGKKGEIGTASPHFHV